MKRTLQLLLALACIAGFVRLGFWQLQRAHFKEALIARSGRVLDARQALSLAAETDAEGPASAGAAEYAWSVGNGHFLPLPAVLLDNQSRGGRPGVRVYRLFQPDTARRALLVELGWRPLPPDRTLPSEPSLPRTSHVQGLLAPPPAAGLDLGSGDAIQRQPDGALLLTRLQPDHVAAALGWPNGIAPRVLRLDPALALGYARDLDVLSGAMPPARHRGYAVQWFAMALALLIATLLVSRRRTSR